MRNYCLYKHTVPNGKVYIGITCVGAENRWHYGHGYKNNPAFYNAIVKYGWRNIKHEILLDGLTKEEAEEEEIKAIKVHNSANRKYGYNISPGGHLTANQYCHPVLQCTLKGEKLKRWRSVKEAARSNGIRPETMTAALRDDNDVLTCCGFLWIYADKEYMLPEKVAYLQSRFVDGMKVHPVVGISDNGTKIYFRSMSEAQRYGYLESAIQQVVAGKRKKYKGYLWRLTTDEDAPLYDCAPRVEIKKKQKNRAVIATSVVTGESIYYSSTHQAEKDGHSRGCIRAVLVGKKISHHGYYWKYANE